MGLYFDYATKKCGSCLENMEYKEDSHSCIKKTVFRTNLDDEISFGRIIFEDGEHTITSAKEEI